MMDLNKDGVLDKFEFILAQRSLGYIILSNFMSSNLSCRRGPLIYGIPYLDGDIDRLFAVYDRNCDGRVDFTEFESLIQESLMKSPWRAFSE